MRACLASLRARSTLSPLAKIDLYYSLNGYDWQAFRLLLIEAAGRIPCLLCGELHRVRIHAVLWRKVRSPETGENTEITIVSIICRKAKERGRQYTKRLLPAFLIPFCQIGREGVLRYLRLYAKGRIVYRLASAMLGARDKRTIRRHLAMGLAEIGQAALQLATLLSQVPAYATVAERPLGQSDCQYLEALAEQVHRAGRRAHGGSVPRIPAVGYVHLASLFSRSSRPLVPPLSCVLKAIVFHDTS